MQGELNYLLIKYQSLGFTHIFQVFSQNVKVQNIHVINGGGYLAKVKESGRNAGALRIKSLGIEKAHICSLLHLSFLNRKKEPKKVVPA